MFVEGVAGDLAAGVFNPATPTGAVLKHQSLRTKPEGLSLQGLRAFLRAQKKLGLLE